MRLKPKRLGDEFTLDEYNACQYLLYKVPFAESIRLQGADAYTGKFATYLLDESRNTSVGIDKYDTFEILKDLTHNTQYIYITLSNLINQNLQYTATMYYQTPEVITVVDQTNEQYSVNPQDAKDVKMVTQVASEDVRRDYQSITVQCTQEGNTLKIPLYIEGEDGTKQGISTENTIFSRLIDFTLTLSDKPYIDVNNGKANQIDEILLDNVQEFQKIVPYTPQDNVKIIYRLDSNYDYKLTKTFTIQENMNVEIRGGTNKKSKIIGTNTGRLFIIKPGGTLTLQNIHCYDATANNTSYAKGCGGAILIETNEESYGTLTCNDSLFEKCTAELGGAIYSPNAKLALERCTFQNCSVQGDGGAVFYQAKRVKIAFPDIITKPGQTITLKVNVTDMDGEKIDTGTIQFILNSKELDKVDIHDGVAQVQYKVPSDFKQTSFNVIAYLQGTSTTSRESVQNTVFVQQPPKLTFKCNTSLKGYPGDKIRVTVEAYEKNTLTTECPGVFTVFNKTYNANIDTSTNKYYLDVTIPSTNTAKSYSIQFTCKDAECTPLKGTITVLATQTSGISAVYVNNTPSDLTISQKLINTWVNKGITDAYVRCSDYTGNNFIDKVLQYTKNTKIRVHATLNCFHDENGFINPENTNNMNSIKKDIKAIHDNTNIAGFHLDYIRYATANSDENKHKVITKQVKALSDYIYSLNTKYIVSGTVMPEGATNSPVYGQNFKELGSILDYICLMAYKGNYKTNDTWIGQQVKYAKDNGSKVVCALQTYNSDNDSTRRTVADMEASIKVAIKNGAIGYALFREGRLPNYPRTYDTIKKETQ